MNLKTACKTALILAVVSVALITIGYVWVYLPIFRQRPDLGFILQTAAVVSAPLLIGIGLFVFLAALANRVHNTPRYDQDNAVFLLPAAIILIGTLIGAGSFARSIMPVYEHYESLRFFYHAAIGGLSFLGGLSLVLLSVRVAGSRSKPTICLLLTFAIISVYVAVMVSYHIIFIEDIWLKRTVVQNTGGLILTAGHFTRLATILLFSFTWLRHRPLPPEVLAAQPWPVPTPTLSTEASPEQES